MAFRNFYPSQNEKEITNAEKEIADFEVNISQHMGTSTAKTVKKPQSTANEFLTETSPKGLAQAESSEKEETCWPSTPERYVRTRPHTLTVWRKSDTQTFSPQKKMLFDVLTSERKHNL